jgi:phosphinothricin acetyltransferase
VTFGSVKLALMLNRGTVRDAMPDRDAAACLGIYAPYVLGTAVSFEEKVPEMDEFGRRIEEALASHAWLVFELDGKVVGYAYAGPHRTRAAYRWATDVSAYVEQAHQGKGIGRRLYSELIQRLKDLRFQVACAGITLPNSASVGLHQAFGFKPVGVYHRIGWKLGAWHDVGWWQLELAPAATGQPAEPVPGARSVRRGSAPP